MYQHILVPLRLQAKNERLCAKLLQSCPTRQLYRLELGCHWSGLPFPSPEHRPRLMAQIWVSHIADRSLSFEPPVVITKTQREIHVLGKKKIPTFSIL